MTYKLTAIKSKVVFVAAIVVATLVGGAFTNLVSASIPDGNGKIQACYRTKGGDLRVIDTGTSESCSNQETTISWDQTASQPSEQTNISYVSLAFNDATQSIGIDSTRTKNVSAYQAAGHGTLGSCFVVDFAPKSAQLQVTSGGDPGYAVTIKSPTSGWFDVTSNRNGSTIDPSVACQDLPGANAFTEAGPGVGKFFLTFFN